MAARLEPSFEVSGTLLDIVNYALSLDIAGSFSLADKEGRQGGLLFSGRLLRQAWLGELRDMEALRALAGIGHLNCLAIADAADDGGQLSLDYDQLLRMLKTPGGGAPHRSPVSEQSGAPQRITPGAAADMPFPKMSEALFAEEKEILLFGAMMGPRVQCRAPGWPNPRPETLAPLVRLLREQGDALKKLQAFLLDGETCALPTEQISEMGNRFIGIRLEKDTPWMVFVIMEKPIVLGDARMRGNLDQLWADLKRA